MKRISLLLLLFGTSIVGSIAYASSNYAYIVDADYMVRRVSLLGPNVAKSPTNFALSVSVGRDGSVWVVSTDQGVIDRGGNLLKVMRKGSTRWETVKISSGAEAVNVSGDASGGAWVVDGQTHNIIQIDPKGKVISGPSNIGPMFEVSAAFSGDFNSQIWAISSEPNQNIGNPVYYQFTKDGKWKSRGVGAQDLSGYWLVNRRGEVVTAASDSSQHSMSPVGMASSISVGNSGIWVISTEANIQQGGAYLRIWDQKGNKAENWPKIPKVGARSVSAE